MAVDGKVGGGCLDIKSAWCQIFLKFIEFAVRRCFTINTDSTDNFLFQVMGMPLGRSHENNRVSQERVERRGGECLVKSALDS